MPKPFYDLSIEEFSHLIDRYSFTRQITAVDIHHTWRPRHDQYQGQNSVESMWRYHTQDLGWSDIAQHVTIGPDGLIWTGRDWNRTPASASGYNGNSYSGPFMLEVIGDFDVGCDRFDGLQKEVTLKLIAIVQQHFNLPVESLRFHNQMSSKTCPGSAIDYDMTLSELTDIRDDLNGLGSSGDLRLGGSQDLLEGQPPFSQKPYTVEEVINSMTVKFRGAQDPQDAELPEETASEFDIERMSGSENATEPVPGARDIMYRGLTPDKKNMLRGHVINLSEGQFSSEGDYTTEAIDVDRIFNELAVSAYQKTSAAGQKLKFVFYAHGGLTNEKSGLNIAFNQVLWWKANNIFPIFFVWETGFLETISQLINSKKKKSRGVTTRDFWDKTTDPVIERLCRSLGVKTMWSGMKYSAAQAHVAQTGGAWYVATKLAEFLKTHPDTELHAIGHSAGSIFHSHFIPCCLDQGCSSFKTLSLLAPAISVDDFIKRMSFLLGKGKGVEHTTILTMNKDWERDDHTAGIYRKSLLYLIYHALESKKKTAILGLEESIRKSDFLVNLLGLGGTYSKEGTVIWSKSRDVSGLKASRSTSHGGFDNDPASMNNVLRRVLDIGGDDAIVEFPENTRELAQRTLNEAQKGFNFFDDDEFDWLFNRNDEHSNGTEQPVIELPSINKPSVTPAINKKALCIGINEYPNPQEKLGGCVNDAHEWATTFKNIGYTDVTMLLDGEATREGILSAIRTMIADARSGDNIVIQYSGHGTQAQDYDDDEWLAGSANQGQNDGLDEALCPVDYAWGGLIIDDDLKAIFKSIPNGVSVTGFFDCCHSATMTRGFSGSPLQRAVLAQSNVKARYITLSSQASATHKRMREEIKAQRSGLRSASHSARQMTGLRPLIKEITFSACKANEVALESNGQGHFTKHAISVMAQGISSLTNAEFMDRVVVAFGPDPAQHPNMDSSEASLGKPFLG